MLSEKAILLAADECAGAERALGLLKKTLSEWADAQVKTVGQAEEALKKPKAAPAKKKKKNAALLYEQTPISEDDFNQLVVDLNEDV